MRPRILVVIVAVAMAAAAMFWLTHRSKLPAGQPASTSASPAAATARTSLESSQHGIEMDILHLGLTAERAKLLFSLVVGPLPGVSIDKLTGDPANFDGTQAVIYLGQVWDRLTPDERRAADALIRVTPRGRSGAPVAWRDRAAGPRVILASFEPTLGADDPAHDYDSLAKNANNTLSDRLGVPPVQETVDVQYGEPEGTEYAHATSWWSPFDTPYLDKKVFLDGKCHVIVWNKKFLGLDDISTSAILTHEMVHCYQDRVAGSYPVRATQHPWVAEGTATWAMADLVGSASQIVETKWSPYVYGPKTVYSDRSYDAIGVFGHLSDISSSTIMWSRLLPVVEASEGGQDADAFNVLTQGVSTSYFTNWGSSYFQSGHDRWRIASPGSPPSSGPSPDDATVNPGTDTSISAPSYQATLANVSGGSDILVVALLTGYGRVHDQGWGIDTGLDSSGPLALCLRDAGCKCEDDSDIPLPEIRQATAPISIGIDGGDQIAIVGLSGHSLNEFCKKKPEKTPTPTPPPGGGGGGGGGGGPDQDPDRNPGNGDSVGDPHLKTFDGVRFDFQRIGEYTLVRSTKDDFVVQVRQVPVFGSRAVSVNQSMATKIRGKRVTVSLENGAAVLRINGAVVTGEPPAMPGVSLTRTQTGYGVNYVFESPDGTVVRAEQLSRYTINVRVRPSESRRGTLEGLLGNDDGSVDNDIAESAALAEKWAVPSSASLFDYQAGQTSATFVDPTFPDPSATVPNREAADKACREQGITDPQLLHDCIIDFGVTNGFLFASQYAHQQKVLEARMSLAPMNASTTAVPKEKILTMAGTITDKTQPTEFKFDAQENDVIYMHQPDCVDRSETSVIFFALFDPNGKMIGGGHPGCEMGRYILPAAGTYTIKGNMGKNQLGKYSVPIRFLRHDRVQAIKYGDIISGNIEQKAAHDLYAFSAKPGDLIQISGKGCELSGMFTSIISPDGFDALGPLCRDGTVYRVLKTGDYKLLINSDDGGPGKYQFVFQGVGGG